ncbi:hypothetical protein LZC95_15610 [Pendulispora brunnea]|uniref:Uncharacterized protein n=1 Tax=Pendulispora brunnea TaxID=2905690 RepID=A0ABZ2KMF6_9BACT
MKHRLLFAAVVCGGVALSLSSLAADHKASAAAAAAVEAPTVSSLAPQLEGFRWGMTRADVIKAHNQLNGVFDREYNPLLIKMQPGVRMQALESERETRKLQFAKSLHEFKDVPSGFDATGLKGEYSYRNNESALVLEGATKRRFFFFVGSAPGERLWKIYDEVKLIDGGSLGKTYQEAVSKMSANVSVQGKARNADPSRWLILPYTEWQDGSTHLRVVDRSSERLVGVAMEERNTFRNISAMRPNKLDDPMALDPSIQLVTKGGISDPNAKPAPGAGAEASVKAGAGKAAAKKK